MSSFGQLSAALFLATSENNLALANLKFDFSLMKVEAPAEFSGLGSALSRRRRMDAEEGQPHRTARRLGSLLEQLIPSTPQLITAFGLRSSEIMETPAINPLGSATSGPFQTFVGADGTAMWAAATSGIPALAVYLLACFLARIWDAKAAVSIWVELCAERRREIEGGIKANHAISESSLLSVRQEISRSDLATWDASARAWLRCADQAKVKEQDQMMLLIKNVQLPFDSSGSTYSKVIESWRQAMIGLENLLCGKPQTIFNNAILVAMSAWHLYPDLIVLDKQTKSIKFADRFAHPGGVGTINLSRAEPLASAEGTQWSLLLSHLRYYGGPVEVKSNLDFTRVNISQLHLIAFGTILSSWEVRQKDIIAVAQWFTVIWDYLCQADEEGHKTSSMIGIEWFGWLAEAARSLLPSKEKPNTDTLRLVLYGQRRAKFFLGDSSKFVSPFFGLARESTLAGLAEEDEEEQYITYLRQRVKGTGMNSGDAFILRQSMPSQRFGGDDFIQVISAIPHSRASRKRKLNEQYVVKEEVHTRWHEVRENPQTSHGTEAFDALSEFINNHGEQIIEIRDIPEDAQKVEGALQWAKSPVIFRYAKLSEPSASNDGGTSSGKCPSLFAPGQHCQCLDYPTNEMHPKIIPTLFRPVLNLGPFKLCVREGLQYRYRLDDSALRVAGQEYLHPKKKYGVVLKSKDHTFHCERVFATSNILEHI